MSRLTLDGKAEPVSRDQILRRVMGTGQCSFSLVQLTTSRIAPPYPVDPYSAIMELSDDLRSKDKSIITTPFSVFAYRSRALLRCPGNTNITTVTGEVLRYYLIYDCFCFF